MEQRKVARLEKKTGADKAAKALRMAFDFCKPACKCGVVPCPQETLQLCETCGDIKKGLCRKLPCVTAREPLRLTMCEETAMPALEAAPEPVPVMVEVREGFIPLAQKRPRRVM